MLAFPSHKPRRNYVLASSAQQNYTKKRWMSPVKGQLLWNLLQHYLAKSKCSTTQLYSTVNSDQSDVKTFNYSIVHGWVGTNSLFVYADQFRAYNMCTKRALSARMHALSRACRWSMDALIMRCSLLFYFIYLHNWKAWKYRNNFTMSPASGRKYK